MLIGSSVPSPGDSPAAAFRRAEYCRAPAGLCVVSAEKAQLCPAPEIKRAVVQFGMALGQLESNGIPYSYHCSGLVLTSLYPAGLGVCVPEATSDVVHLPVPKDILQRKLLFCLCVCKSPLNFEVAVG